MSIIKKPDLKIFAQDAKTGEIESFPDILRGWGITLERTAGKPPLEWFNAIGKRVDEWLMYLTQRGVAEWDVSLSYPKTAIVQFNNIVYVSIKETKGEQPDKSQTSWSTLGLFLGLDKYSTTAAMNLELNKKMDKANISGVLGNDNDKVPSLNLLTTELGKKQPAGNYVPAGYSHSKGESDSRYQPKGNYQLAGDYLDKSSTSDQVVNGGLYGSGEAGVGNPRGQAACLLLKTIGVDEPQIIKRESGTAPWLNFRLPKNSGRLGRENTSKSSDSGYLICGDTGLIIQWGSVTSSTSQSDFRQFPISFKEGCFQLVSSYAEFVDYGMGTACYPTSKSEFIITKRSHTGTIVSGAVRYIAIGY